MQQNQLTWALAVLFFFALGLFIFSIPDIYPDLNLIPTALDQISLMIVVVSVVVSLILAANKKTSDLTLIVSLTGFLILEFKFFETVYRVLLVKQSPIAVLILAALFVLIAFAYYRKVKAL